MCFSAFVTAWYQTKHANHSTKKAQLPFCEKSEG